MPFHLPIIEHIPITSSVTETRIDISGVRYLYEAGQFTTLSLPCDMPRHEKMRDFSLSSSPHQKQYISVTYRNGQSLFKNKLRSMKPGELVDVEKASGGFTLPNKPTGGLVFIAGGVGVTPFYSMLSFISHTNKSFNPKLYYFTSDSEVIYRDELHALPFQVFENQGRVNLTLLEEAVSAGTSATFYVAGPPAMTESTIASLKSLGISQNKIKHEDFAGY